MNAGRRGPKTDENTKVEQEPQPTVLLSFLRKQVVHNEVKHDAEREKRLRDTKFWSAKRLTVEEPRKWKKEADEDCTQNGRVK